MYQLNECNKIAKFLYNYFIPDSFRYRRNVDYCKLKDYEVIGLLLFQALLGIITRIRFYRFIKINHIIPVNKIPEESRFNRICNRDGKLLHKIRLGVINSLHKPTFTVIDSIPIPLCKMVRNHRAKVLHKYANIGYKATKKAYFYGFKGHFEVNNQGVVVASILTKASIHDLKMAKPLLNRYSSKCVLTDKGYLSKKLKKNLAKNGISFWTPVRKNMKPYHYDDRLLRIFRRKIESVFAQLCRLFNIEHNYGKSLKGFKSRFEQCLLLDTLIKLKWL